MEMSTRLGRVTGPEGGHIAWQGLIAAALGDREDAVRLLQEAFALGATHSVSIHREPAYDDMWGYAPWDALVAPR
jgi:hypothetical protein